MSERRPDPDELVARLREEEKTSSQGKLTIFFGAAPGVGKTYTMLEAARLEIENQRRDVVVGIDVFSTLNVQHLESLNDVVAQITGVVVRETVPDAVFDRAYEVRVVDLPVDQLLERLREGKVYLPDQAARAVENFFKEGNLIALRELALRRTAERVDAKMRGYKAAHGIEESRHTGERVLVCVSPSPHSARLVRAARR